MKKVVQMVVVGGILVHKGKALIVKRNKDDSFGDLWEVPGGKKEELEPVEKALIREFKEEAGVEVKVIKPVYIFNYNNDAEGGVMRDATQIDYLVEVESEPKIILSEEHEALAWVTKNEINNYNISPETKTALIKALEC